MQGAQVMLIGSSISDVMKVNLTPDQASTVVAEGSTTPPPSNLLCRPYKRTPFLCRANAEETKSTEPLCEQTKHKKIIEKGLPDNVLRGVKGRNVRCAMRLPSFVVPR